MICDNLKPEDLTQQEICRAFALYLSLHGLHEDMADVQKRVERYVVDKIPDITIEDAILAYWDDAIEAPPDIILEQWEASRVYELEESRSGDHRHKVCEAWFEEGCQLPIFDQPALVHFWTRMFPGALVNGTKLPAGSRLSFRCVDKHRLEVSHRACGVVGTLPNVISQEILSNKWSHRKFLALVDRIDSRTCPWPDPSTTRLLVISSNPESPSQVIAEYATKVYSAKRAKC